MYKVKNIGTDERQIYNNGKWVILRPGESTTIKNYIPSTDILKVTEVKKIIKAEVDKK